MLEQMNQIATLNDKLMNPTKLKNIILKTCKNVAPVWPIKNTVAVNPFLGFSDQTFYQTTRILDERSGINTTMKLDFYLDSIQQNEICSEDLSAALKKNNKSSLTPDSFLSKVEQLRKEPLHEETFKIKTITDLSFDLTGKNWNDFMVDNISAWASAYYDDHQALWKTVDGSIDLFNAWKIEASVDLSTEIMGIKNFRANLKTLSEDPLIASSFIIHKLGLTEETLEIHLHTLLLKMLGWSSYTAGMDWHNNLYNENSHNLSSFLTILLTWEYCLFESMKSQGIENTWKAYKTALIQHEEIGSIDKHLENRIILQDAYDFACERQLKAKFKKKLNEKAQSERPKAQAVFCIDVRSEVYRRHLEKANSQIETIGFAGFFGFPINYIPLTHEAGKNQCPVLIPSGPVVREAFSENDKASATRTTKHQVSKTWKKYSSGAITSFGFVSTMGLFRLPKLIGNSFHLMRPVENPDEDGLAKYIDKGRKLDLSGITLSEKINMAAGALTAMGLKDKMAPFVLIIGHGSTSVNNPHASGLDCGACGGHSGEINAMTAAAVLNDDQVRKGLVFEKGIHIPDDTFFIAGKHNTTTDEISLIGKKELPESLKKELSEIEKAFKKASEDARKERATRFGIAPKDAEKLIAQKGNDWSQIRPEWGLAGCNSFIIAPRHRTNGINLEGKSFLHSYEWKSDDEFKILETIMTAPMVVTSWINLQYYASTTDNERLGSGNKTLHNVTGGIGVLEGSAGDLRIGLPLQSVHDGTNYQHLPQRLNVIIEAPIEAITSILKKHESIRNLCDNSWITLLTLNPNGEIGQRYCGNYKWENTTIKSIHTELNTVINF